jgi:V/A-type H+-transporting ATPase subunit I
MIIPVIKYLIIGANEDLNLFFEKAQETGFMEFITKGQKKITQQPLHIQNLFAAIKILRKLPRGEPYLGSSDLQLTIQTSERILELSHNLEKLVEEKRVIEAEILRVSPFGRFSLSDLIELENQSNRRIQFFCMKAGKHNNLAVLQEVIYITTEYDLDYFIAINQQLVSYPDMIEMKIETSLGELESRLNNVHNAINRFEKELKSFAGYIGLLQHNLVEELNAHRLSYAKNEVSYPLNNSLFSVEIWIPENKEKDLFKLIENLSIHAEKLLIEKNEVVPTCIDNNGLGLVGEDLMKIYDIPNPHDKDPSHWVLWSFALFFSIIIGDGGYGFIFLLLAFFLKKIIKTCLYSFDKLYSMGSSDLILFRNKNHSWRLCKPNLTALSVSRSESYVSLNAKR